MGCVFMRIGPLLYVRFTPTGEWTLLSPCPDPRKNEE